MENKIKRILIGFFVVMIIFTFLSRAAATAMVAKVQVDHVKRGNLTYEVSGTGLVKADAHKFINLMIGYKIGEVTVESGQQVKEGDVLFTYDMDRLNEIESDRTDELKKLQLQYQSIGLIGGVTDNSLNEETANQVIENAKEDINALKQEMENIIDNVKEKKQEEYEKAVASLDDINASKEKVEKEAAWAVKDVEDAFAEIKKPEVMAAEKINSYKTAVESKDNAKIQSEIINIYDLLYDNKYEEHQQKVYDAQKCVTRAKEDYSSTVQKWNNIEINEIDQYLDKDTKNAYYQLLETKKAEINSAARTVQDAVDSLNDLTKKDVKLNDALTAYMTDLQNYPINVEKSYSIVYEILTDGKAAKQDDIAAVEIKLSRAKEDQEEVSNEWSRKLNTALEEKDKLEKELSAIKTGDYDYTKDLEDINKSYEEAQRVLEAAKLQLKQSKEAEQSDAENYQKQEESDDIQRSILELDINKKQEELNQLQGIIAENGKILAPVAGMISENDLEQGITLTGQEKLVITTGGYELAMTADQEVMKYFAVGDEIKILTGADSNTITSQIENIELPDKDKKVTFIALLPEKDYQLGASLDYMLSKDSQTYSMCIPIQALRQDSRGIYVLLVKSKDSVLGKVEEAFRMNVTVLSKDSKFAAIDASITENDNIISGSNRNFTEGDRVRIYEME